MKEFFVKMILGRISPMIKDALEELLRNWYAKALETDNPWDNVACEFLAEFVGVDLEGGSQNEGE